MGQTTTDSPFLPGDPGVVISSQLMRFWYPDLDVFKYIFWSETGDIAGNVKEAGQRRIRREMRPAFGGWREWKYGVSPTGILLGLVFDIFFRWVGGVQLLICGYPEREVLLLEWFAAISKCCLGARRIYTRIHWGLWWGSIWSFAHEGL